MTATSTSSLSGPYHDDTATLVRIVPVRVVEVSRGGCRLESLARLAEGLSGQLMLNLQGMARTDDIRVTRCQQSIGGSAVFRVGAEFLRTRRLSRRSVRLAVRKVISEQTKAAIRVPGETPVPSGPETWAGETASGWTGRAPPAPHDRGP